MDFLASHTAVPQIKGMNGRPELKMGLINSILVGEEDEGLNSLIEKTCERQGTLIRQLAENKPMIEREMETADTTKNGLQTCPITGLSIVSPAKWLNVGIGDNFRTTLSVIGDRIILSRSSGYATMECFEEFWKLLLEIEESAIAKRAPYLWLDDYTEFSGADAKVRKYLFHKIKNHGRLLGRIIFAASPMCVLNIRLGKLWSTKRLKVKSAKNYAEAISLALKMISHADVCVDALPAATGPSILSKNPQNGRSISSQPTIDRQSANKQTKIDSPNPPNRKTFDHWALDFDDYSIRFETIDSFILHVHSSGFLKEDYLDEIFEVQEAVINSDLIRRSNYYFINGVKELKKGGGSRKARKRYYREMVEWYKRYPFQMFIFYGMETLLRGMINLVVPFVPFQVRLVKDLKSAFELIAKEESEHSKPLELYPAAANTIPNSQDNRIQQYGNELIKSLGGFDFKFLSSVDWETRNMENEELPIDPDHPLASVFEAISIIKKDFTDLFQERQQEKKELRKSYDELEERIENRTKELAKSNMDLQAEIVVRKETEKKLLFAKTQAEAANNAKSEFLSNMSHELRTPMHHVLAYSKFGIDKMGTVSEGKLLHYFTQIRKTGERLTTLLDSILDLSKLESGMMEFQMRKSDIERVIDYTVKEIETAVAEKGITLEVLKPDVSTEVQCDNFKIGQVVHNLLSNAIKFTESGKKITVSIASTELPVGRRASDDRGVPAVEVKVEDQGIGIPDSELKLVFNKFVQSSKTNTGAGGTGLGLAICQEIIKGHKGRIWAENNPGGGVVFCFSIPCQQDVVAKK